MTSLLKFIKIYQLVQKLLGGDTQTERRTDRQTGDIISLTFLFKESRLIKGNDSKILVITGSLTEIYRKAGKKRLTIYVYTRTYICD
jgi:hypothetical protein